MEHFTSGKVSAMARKAYLEVNPSMLGAFTHTRNGYVMRAWESQIAYARAYGRGTASGLGIGVHPFDVRD